MARPLWMHALVALTSVLTLGSTARADSIVIGQTAGFSGPAAAAVKDITRGAQLYLDIINTQGGVFGRRIELVSLDDKFDPELAEKNAQQLLQKNKVTALFLTRGTDHSMRIAAQLAKARVPLIAPSTGAMSLHKPVNPWVFNVRTPYQREAEYAVQHLASNGYGRIGIVKVDDNFGTDAEQGAQAGLAKVGVKAVFTTAVARDASDFSALVSTTLSAKPQALLFLTSAKVAAQAITALRRAGSDIQAVTLSLNASSGFIQDLGAYARGVIVSQTFPPERSRSTAFIREAAEAADAAKAGGLSPAMLEGFVGAKVLVEGLRKAGPDADGAKLRSALEGLGRFDLGGIVIDYGPNDHTGMTYVDLSIISQEGTFRR